VPRGTIGFKKIVLRQFEVFIFFLILSGTFSHLQGKTPAGLLELHSTCPEERFEEKYFFLEKFNLISFPDSKQKSFGTSNKFF